jgi:hypothetical protein
MKKTVKFTLDIANPPALTDAQKAEIVTLSNITDAAIDFSDIPRLSPKAWADAEAASKGRKPASRKISKRCDPATVKSLVSFL